MIADFLDPSRGPSQSGGFEVDPSFFFVLLVVGFVVGVVGHIAQSRTVVAIGVGLIFLATVAIPVALGITH